jgi:protein-S-isoprenylcysteine O-methyltransferase Ste14
VYQATGPVRIDTFLAVRLRKRKVTYAVLGLPPHILGYVVAPLVVSRFGIRHGWRADRPGHVNVVGLLPLGAGGALLSWAIASHYRTAPEEAEVTLLPTYLVDCGAYGLTRNPMYLGGAAMLGGWAVFLGSVPVVLAAVGYILGMDRAGIPFEERILHDKFGDSYDEYRDHVPRWL